MASNQMKKSLSWPRPTAPMFWIPPSSPGRFDRRVTIDPPDRHDRLEILKIHARSKPFAEDVNLMSLPNERLDFLALIFTHL
jgi:SpoVK/Ycf46/Vps4 family AAA+-type ATPase